GGGATVQFGTTTTTGSTTIDTSGGTLDGQAGTPDQGVHVAIPADAFQIPTQVSVGYNDGTVTPDTGTWGGVIIDLTTDYGLDFEDAVRITMPFSGGTDVVPIPYYIKPDGTFEPCELIGVDRGAGTFSFDTWHASSFTYILALLDHPDA